MMRFCTHVFMDLGAPWTKALSASGSSEGMKLTHRGDVDARLSSFRPKLAI
jgi:hypothetical protein